MANAKYWVGVLYPENMIDDWQVEIGDILQLPYAYCVHDKDLDNDDDERKLHVHMIIVFPNTTTYKHALNTFNLLSKPNHQSINKCENIINIRNKYNYLIHDTETCRKKNKYLYDKSERITGNNFDIGAYEQLSTLEKEDMIKELCNLILYKFFVNFGDFYEYVINNFDSSYFSVIKSHSGLFERLTKSNFQKWSCNK